MRYCEKRLLLLFLAGQSCVKRNMHVKCRNTDKPYPRSDVYRVKVDDSRVSWAVPWHDYNPKDFTSSIALSKPWSDRVVDGKNVFLWNDIDGVIDRRSHLGKYELDGEGRPRNPFGRTGIRGRGVLGKWGPNHAADPVVSRFLNGKLQFIGIARRDSGEWAIPGGMIDAGETVLQALRREFTEEALDGKNWPHLEKLWQNGFELYRGYVDDPRNTDNAWMETVVMNFHDEQGIFDKVELKAGDDAVKVRWINVTASEKLYASHEDFIKILAERHNVEF